MRRRSRGRRRSPSGPRSRDSESAGPSPTRADLRSIDFLRFRAAKPHRVRRARPIDHPVRVIARRPRRVGLLMLIFASDLGPARSQMAFTLGFHIILASLGVALPAMMLIANYVGLRRNDRDALLLARRWSKAVAVTFAVGAVTGTVLSFEFGLLWPAFTGRFGEVFGVLFAIEGICFFLEA